MKEQGTAIFIAAKETTYEINASVGSAFGEAAN